MYKYLNKINSPEDLKKLNNDQLNVLCIEIRDFLLRSISETGGHLASNLGVVELSIALHRTFKSPYDKIIFDVGHQGYIHKILTGRKDSFDSLRQYGGLSGFLKRKESIHDQFDAGHSSTSISVAAGFAKGIKYKNGKNRVVAVIGDGAMTGGMAYEAMNNIGHSKEPVIIVLNDNEMSISENVGGLSETLDRLRTAKKYTELKDLTKTTLSRIPRVGDSIISGARRAKDSIKYFLVPGMFFEDLGFTYIGPVDGHNIEKIEEALERAKSLNEPAIVHVITKKGKGYKPAENNPGLYHGVGPFDLKKGVVSKKGSSYSDYFGKAMVDIAKNDSRVFAITAAMADGTGLTEFKEKFPEQFIDVGIAEQHAVTMSAGLALSGIVPVFAVYSTFLQRAYDQILHDVCIQNLHVVFAIDRAGIVGQDGETHHGVFDIAYLKHIPNMKLLAPTSGEELELMVKEAIYKVDGPVAIRYPRGDGKGINKYKDILLSSDDSVLKPSVIYKSNIRSKKNVTIIALGSMAVKAMDAIEYLEKDKINVKIINPKIATPEVLEDIAVLIKDDKNIVTIEDGVIIGGFGQMVGHAFRNKQIIHMGFPREFIPAGTQNDLFAAYKLNGQDIYNKIKEEFYQGK